MSDVESSTASSGDMETMYKCRKCNKQFTEAERDAHRAVHQREKEKARRPGPRRATSPTRSEATLFEPIVIQPSPEVEDAEERGNRKRPGSSSGPSGGKPGPASSKKPRRGRQSIKTYKKDVKWNRNNSG